MKWTPVVTLVLAASLAVLSGCSEEEPAPSPTIGDDATGSPDPTPSPSPSAAPEEAFDEQGHEALLGRTKVAGPEQEAIADAWRAYWQVRLDAYAGPSLDPTALGEVAQGEAAEQVISYVGYLERENLRTEGDVRLSVARVRVRGDQATIESCGENRSVDVRPNGRPAEIMQPFYLVRGTFQRVETDRWVVTNVVRLNTNPCA